jgi:hypothetical protein
MAEVEMNLLDIQTKMRRQTSGLAQAVYIDSMRLPGYVWPTPNEQGANQTFVEY